MTSGEDVPAAPPIDLELTRVVNVQMHFEGETVMVANQTLHDVSTDLALHDGHLTLTPVFRLANGITRAQIEVEDRGEAPLHMAIRAEIAPGQRAAGVSGAWHGIRGHWQCRWTYRRSDFWTLTSTAGIVARGESRLYGQRSGQEHGLAGAGIHGGWDPADATTPARCQPGACARRAGPP